MNFNISYEETATLDRYANVDFNKIEFQDETLLCNRIIRGHRATVEVSNRGACV